MLVSRGRLELALHNLAEMRALHQADVAYYRNKLDQAQDANRSLTAELLTMRHTGFVSGPQRMEPVKRPSRPADLAIEEVVEQRNGGAALRRVLQRYVNLERQKADADEDKIAERVKHWSDPDSEEDAA